MQVKFYVQLNVKSRSTSPPPEEIQDEDCQNHPNVFDPSINMVPPLDEPQYRVREPHCVENI